MKLPHLPTSLLAACALAGFSSCATMRNMSSPSFAKIRLGGAPVAVTTSPTGATVWVDSKSAGVSPLTARPSTLTPHLITATKDGAGESAVIVLAVTKDQPARRFEVNAAGGLSETTGFASGELNLVLKPAASSDPVTATLAAVSQADQLEAAGKLTKQQHADLDRKIVEFFSHK